MPSIAHLLNSQNDDFEDIITAASAGTHLDWTCPKTAKVGDRALFFVSTDGIVARGVVDSPPEQSKNRNRRYVSRITSVKLLSTYVSLSSILAEMPDFGWARYPRSYVTLSGTESEQMENLIKTADLLYSDCEPDSATFVEGAAKWVQVNSFERSVAARREAIRFHGTVCTICSFDFADRYGSEMSGFIHIHHQKALNEIQEAYMVDPKSDLVPVCPNCHAVIHSRRPALTIPQVRAMLRNTQSI